MKSCAHAVLGAALWVVLSGGSWAFEEGLVSPNVTEIGDFRTVSGSTLRSANVSWESYGTLNADKSNAILIVPFFTGTPHAAGKYTADDEQPGYWDNIIGSGMPLDTDKYFILSVDALCNMNKVPTNLTTGPASTNPDTGKPYGSTFPVLTLEDFVHAQKAVVNSLGITKLHAVMGFSMGAAQALQWTVSYPDVVERAILVTPWSMANGWNLGKFHVWTAAIKRDPNFNGGDYYDRSPPVAGLTASVEIAIMDATGYGFVNAQFGRAPGQEGADPAVDASARFAAENWLTDTAKGFASAVDANGWLCQAEAMRHFDPSGVGSVADVAAHIESKMLLLPAESDHILPEAGAEQLHEALLAAGKDSTLTPIPGNMGHWNGWFLMPGVGAEVASFLSQ